MEADLVTTKEGHLALVNRARETEKELFDLKASQKKLYDEMGYEIRLWKNRHQDLKVKYESALVKWAKDVEKHDSFKALVSDYREFMIAYRGGEQMKYYAWDDLIQQEIKEDGT